MKHILLVLLIFLIGCQSSSESSFQNLNQAFISWYYKFHPIESTRFGMDKYHGSFRLIGDSVNEEYMADINRFIIELSQIDVTKLDPAKRIDYHILYNNLKKLLFVMSDMRPWEWNPLWVLDEINEGLFLLSERIDIKMEVRVESILRRLKSVSEMLSHSREMMIGSSPIHVEYGNLRIEGIILLLNDLPLKLNSDNLTLDEIDKYIFICKDALLSYKKWLNQDALNAPHFKFPQELKLIDKAFHHFIGERYIPEHVYKLANKKRIPTQNRIFNRTLPIYLEYNDEPVWLDRDDTLEVIHWSIDHILNKPDFQVPASGILDHFYQSISVIEKFANSKELIPKNVNKRIKLDFAPLFFQTISSVNLFDHHPKKHNYEVLYYIIGNEVTGELFPMTSHEIDLINIRKIIPGRSIQIAHAQKYPSQIRYMFPDPVTTSGWEIYAIEMLINEEFDNWGNEYHILKLKEEIMLICQAIYEEEYYSGKMNSKDAFSFLRKQAFLTDSEAKKLIMQSTLHYFSGTQAFTGMMELNSLLAEYKRGQGDDYHISNFNNIILKDGIIPLYELKKQIFSH